MHSDSPNSTQSTLHHHSSSNPLTSYIVILGKRAYNKGMNESGFRGEAMTDDMKKVIKLEWEMKREAEDDEDEANSNSEFECKFSSTEWLSVITMME